MLDRYLYIIGKIRQLSYTRGLLLNFPNNCMISGSCATLRLRYSAKIRQQLSYVASYKLPQKYDNLRRKTIENTTIGFVVWSRLIKATLFELCGDRYLLLIKVTLFELCRDRYLLFLFWLVRDLRSKTTVVIIFD
jgi:hypothetical protein